MESVYVEQPDTVPQVLPSVPSNAKVDADVVFIETTNPSESEIISDALNGRAVAMYFLIAALLTLIGLGFGIYYLVTHLFT